MNKRAQVIARMMGVALTALSVAACGSVDGAVDTDDQQAEAVVVLPTERPEVGEMCNIEMSSAKRQVEVLPLSLISCRTVPEWLASLEKHLDVVGDRDHLEFLTETCNERDYMSVCADAIERELIPSTGNADVARIEPAAEWCGTTEDVADEGASISMVARADMNSVDCVLAKLDAPSYVSEHIGSTRALDGQQVEEWDEIKARWTYHPDSGLRITLVDGARGR